MFRISSKLFRNFSKSIGNGGRSQRYSCRSLCTNTSDSVTHTQKFTTFDELINNRRIQAQKSLFVQVNSEKSYPELVSYCSQFGEIESAFHYTASSGEQLHFILLEFKELISYENAFSKCSFDAQRTRVPVVSPFLWFKAKDKKKSSKSKIEADSSMPKLNSSDDVKVIDDNALQELLASAETLSDQITIIYKVTKLNELGTRLRFLAGRQLEMALCGMFPNIQAFPFGSSVNGFGRIGCDLDLILRLNDTISQQSTDSRLMYHTKTNLLNERSLTQRQMEVIGDIMHIFLPAINNVRKILLARVPIIKYNHECLDLDVDFSMNNMSGFYMSELLYIFGEMDERVRPLVFCIRKWASSCNITNSAAPGPWMTNFPLTLLTLFFLQNLQKPILPSFMSLIKSATPSDIRVTAEDNINCTFLRDLTKLKFQTTNKDSLQILLLQFFEFYSNFDFLKHGISFIDGKPIIKPDHSAIWITNPFEPELNVSKNVSFEELEKFKLETRNAAWSLESTLDNLREPSWGVMNLLKCKKRQMKAENFYKSRLVNVTELFSTDEEKYENIRYKNPSLRTEVKNIQKATNRNISNLMKSR